MIQISLLALNPGYHLRLLIMKFFHLAIVPMAMEGYSLAVIVVIHVHTLIFKHLLNPNSESGHKRLWTYVYQEQKTG